MHDAKTMAAGGGEERNTLTILWRIENLSYFQRDVHRNSIMSPCFHPGFLVGDWTQLRLFPRGESIDDKNVCLRLYIPSPFKVDCEFSLMAWDESPLVTCKGIHDSEFSLGFRVLISDCLTQEELFVTKKSTFLAHDCLTVQCRLWKSEGNFSNAEFISARTLIEFAERSISWRIAGSYRRNYSKDVVFPIFLRFFLQYVSFELKCLLKVHSTQNPELIIEVSAGKILKNVLAKLEVSVLDNRKEIMKLGSKENLFSVSETKQSWVVPKFMLTGSLGEKARLLTYGRSLHLNFHLTAVCPDIMECIEKTFIGISNLEHNNPRTSSTFSEASCQTSGPNGHVPVHIRKVSTFSEASCQTSEQNGDAQRDLQRRNDYLSTLGEDLFSLYQKQTFSDFELRSGDVCFPVHRNILCARSPVFCSMFSNEMVESKSLDVPDLDAHTLNLMLTFMYGGTVEPDVSLENATKLYYAADKYQVDNLKSLCSSIFQSQISVSNASDILTLADNHQDSDLKAVAHNFILSHFDDVMFSEEWAKFVDLNPALAGKSTHLLYKKRASKRQRLQ